MVCNPERPDSWQESLGNNVKWRADTGVQCLKAVPGDSRFSWSWNTLQKKRKVLRHGCKTEIKRQACF